MTQTLDNSNPIAWFISFLNMLRVDILDRFEIPGLGITWWDFVIGCAIAAVVITVLVNTVRIGSVSYANSKRDKDKPQSQPGSILTSKSTTQRMNDGFGGTYTDTYGKSSGGLWIKR